MKNNFIRAISLFLVLLLVVGLIPTNVSAAVKISKSKATLEVDATLKLKVSGTKSKITWKTNKKDIATVDSTGIVTAKTEGQAIITATVDNMKFTCSVTVVDSNKVTSDKTLNDLADHLKKNKVVSGGKSIAFANMIGGLNGLKYADSFVEIYEYDIDSDSYKNIVKTNKVVLSGFNMELSVSAINGKFILICEDSDNKDKVIECFNKFK